MLQQLREKKSHSRIFRERKLVNQNLQQRKLLTIIVTKNFSHRTRFRITRMSYNTWLNARIKNIAVTSRMKTATGRGPEKMSLVLGHTLLLSGKAG